MAKHIEVNLEKCTACRLCEFACSIHHFGEINPAKARIKVSIVSKDFFYYPNVCKQCSKAPCVEVCPKDALVRDKDTDAVIVNTDDCIGCRLCVRACPFGAMGFHKEDKLADKCDLCGGDPECVKHCFYGALEFKTPEQTVADVSFEYTNKIKTAYLQEVTE
jgi:carbon-monoxide dehydrogenase iron sulfur subunit